MYVQKSQVLPVQGTFKRRRFCADAGSSSAHVAWPPGISLCTVQCEAGVSSCWPQEDFWGASSASPSSVQGSAHSPSPLGLSEHHVCPLGSARPPCSAWFCLSKECWAVVRLCAPLPSICNSCFFQFSFRFLVDYGGSCFFKAKTSITFKILSSRQICAFSKIPYSPGNLN